MEIRLGDRVVGGDDDRIELNDGTTMETNTVIWAAGVKGVSSPVWRSL